MFHVDFDRSRVLASVKPPRIKELCPREECIDGHLYVIYKTDDDTYPDVGKITMRFYHRPKVMIFKGYDTVNNIENFLRANIANDTEDNAKKRENLAVLIEEISKLKHIDIEKIENLFEEYKNILGPPCELYRLCYYWITLCISLDKRIYKGEPTIVNRSLDVYGMVKFIRGDITKKEVLNIWPKILERVNNTEKIKRLTCVFVKEHYRRLKSYRYKNKKDQIVRVRRHVKILIIKEKIKSDMDV